MRRVGLFMLMNIAVLALLAIVLRLLGVQGILQQNGVDIDYRSLLIYSAVLGFSGSLLSLALSKTMAKLSARAKVITQPKNDAEAWLMTTVERLARQSGIGTPEVAIFPSEDPNAFATGARRNRALVAVSVGLLKHMDRDEVEAVLAHEVAHVANGDMVTMTLMQGVLNTFVIFLSRIAGVVIDRAVFRTERGHGPGFFLVTIVLQIVLGILASVILMWFSRRREFRADAGAADLVGAPPMISALQSLQRAHGIPSQLPDSMAAFGIRSGKGRFMGLFRSHPPLEERIAALQARRG